MTALKLRLNGSESDTSVVYGAVSEILRWVYRGIHTSMVYSGVRWVYRGIHTSMVYSSVWYYGVNI